MGTGGSSSFDFETAAGLAGFVARMKSADSLEALGRGYSEYISAVSGGAGLAAFFGREGPLLFVSGREVPADSSLLKDLEKAARGLNGSRVTLDAAGLGGAEYELYPLENHAGGTGVIGAAADRGFSGFMEGFSSLLSTEVERVARAAVDKRRINHLTTYMNVSSVVAQPLGLHDLMENVLYCLLDVFGAEAASVLLADENREFFEFYQVEGEAKPALDGFKIPITGGIAGDVYRTGKNEIVNDVQNDPRFFKNVDAKTTFVTRSMLVTPLTAGEEKVGVLEVINKMDAGPFSGDEGALLATLAEEIAFAIRNARIFDYVVDSYCKQRQGLNTCKGCKRPLGTWTPCVKYSGE